MPVFCAYGLFMSKTMKCLLFLILACYTVRCDETSYYVIQMPEYDSTQDTRKPFKVFWNVPTMQCTSKKIPFENLYQKYGIIQNKGDSFRGEKISILYDPGQFPALLKNETSGKFKFRNGGVPQEGNLQKHLEAFKDALEQSIPDKDFSGIGIIDFESWRPVFRQNFGVLVPYKDISYEIERKMHWWWPQSVVKSEAKHRFESSARAFMQTTLSVAKQMRPNALWGYYGFPYCFNMANNNMNEECSNGVPKENDQTHWLWLESTALYPSVYSSQDLSSTQLALLIRGRVAEAARVRRRGTPILPYFWFRYRDGGYFSQVDLDAALETLYKSSATGFIIWGSSNDVNTVDKCNNLHKYINDVLGPAIAKYTKGSKFDDEVVNVIDLNKTDTNETNNIDKITIEPVFLATNLNNTRTVLDPEFHWVPPENYTQDIKQYVEEELIKKSGPNITDSEKINETYLHSLNNSILLNLILNMFSNSDNRPKKDVEIVIETVKNDGSEIFEILEFDPSDETTTEFKDKIESESSLANDYNTEKSVQSKNEKKGMPFTENFTDMEQTTIISNSSNTINVLDTESTTHTYTTTTTEKYYDLLENIENEELFENYGSYLDDFSTSNYPTYTTEVFEFSDSTTIKNTLLEPENKNAKDNDRDFEGSTVSAILNVLESTVKNIGNQYITESKNEMNSNKKDELELLHSTNDEAEYISISEAPTTGNQVTGCATHSAIGFKYILCIYICLLHV